MNMNKQKTITASIIVATVIMAGGIGYALFVPGGEVTAPSTQPASVLYSGGQGRAVFSIKDTADDLDGISSLYITINRLALHSPLFGWVTISTMPKQYDLLELKRTGSARLLADVTIPSGSYDQIRLDISEVDIVNSEGVS